MKTSSILAAGLVLFAAAGCQAQGAVPAGAVSLQTDDEKTLYALGMTLGKNLSVFGLSPAELEIVKKGLGDAVAGAKAEVDVQAYGPRIRQLAQARAARGAEGEKEKGRVFAEKAAREAGAARTEAGLVWSELKKGTGPAPTPSDVVRVHYRGTLIDGTEFDSSFKRGEPAEFPLSGVIKCWTEGVQKMTVGGKAKLVCPSSIAYGDSGSPPAIPPGATLVFEVELLEIVKR